MHACHFTKLCNNQFSVYYRSYAIGKSRFELEYDVHGCTSISYHAVIAI